MAKSKRHSLIKVLLLAIVTGTACFSWNGCYSLREVRRTYDVFPTDEEWNAVDDTVIRVIAWERVGDREGDPVSCVLALPLEYVNDPVEVIQAIDDPNIRIHLGPIGALGAVVLPLLNAWPGLKGDGLLEAHYPIQATDWSNLETAMQTGNADAWLKDYLSVIDIESITRLKRP